MARTQYKNSIELRLEFAGKIMVFPVNPEEIMISKSADNQDIHIIGQGKATRWAYPGLVTVNIESFFPEKGGDFNKDDSRFRTPKGCVEFINTMWKTDNKKNNVGKFVTVGLPKNVSFYCLVNSFEWEYKAGEESDIYYTLELKQYVPYGARKGTINITGMKSNRANPKQYYEISQTTLAQVKKNDSDRANIGGSGVTGGYSIADYLGNIGDVGIDTPAIRHGAGPVIITDEYPYFETIGNTGLTNRVVRRTSTWPDSSKATMVQGDADPKLHWQGSSGGIKVLPWW